LPVVAPVVETKAVVVVVAVFRIFLLLL